MESSSHEVVISEWVFPVARESRLDDSADRNEMFCIRDAHRCLGEIGRALLIRG